MTWFRTDDDFPEHLKMDALERACGDWQTYAAARTVWHDLGCDCARRRSDGAFQRQRAHRVVRCPADVVDRALAALVAAGFLEAPAADEFLFHDWADYQPTRMELDEQRKAATLRQRARRAKRSGDVGPSQRDTAVTHGASPPLQPRDSGRDVAVTDGVTSAVTGPRDVPGAGTSDVTPPRPVPSRPVPDVRSTPNGVLAAQSPGGDAPPPVAPKRGRADDPPPSADSAAGLARAALACAPRLGALVKRPNALATAAAAAFPGVDLAAEVAKADGWCAANARQAPRSDGDSFLWRWLQRAHNDAANRAARGGQRGALPLLNHHQARRVGPAPCSTAADFARAASEPDPLIEILRQTS